MKKEKIICIQKNVFVICCFFLITICAVSIQLYISQKKISTSTRAKEVTLTPTPNMNILIDLKPRGNIMTDLNPKTDFLPLPGNFVSFYRIAQTGDTYRKLFWQKMNWETSRLIPRIVDKFGKSNKYNMLVTLSMISSDNSENFILDSKEDLKWVLSEINSKTNYWNLIAHLCGPAYLRLQNAKDLQPILVSSGILIPLQEKKGN